MTRLRYLSGAQVAECLPALDERLRLAELAMRSLGNGSEFPPKIGVHPRQAGSVAQAMPALLRGEAGDGSGDLIGVKWIAGFPENPAAGLPAYHSLVIINDQRTGVPRAVMNGAAITASRTSAITGVAIRLIAGARPAGGPVSKVAILGAGTQARAHLPVLGRVLPGSSLRLVDTERARAATLAAAAAGIGGIAAAEDVPTVRDAVDGADVVLSMVSFGPDRQALDPAWLTPHATVVAVDYDMQAPAALAREALFLVDEVEQFRAARRGIVFAGYPDPDGTIGQALRGELTAGPGRDPSSAVAGRALVTHLGVGLADVLFAAVALARAEELGVGRLLPL